MLAAVDPFDPAHFLFFLRQRRGGVLIEKPRLRFRQVPIGKAQHRNRLLAAEWAAEPKLVADAELSMRLTALAVDLNFSSLTRLLCLGARAIQARDVEPDIQPNSRRCISHDSTRVLALSLATLVSQRKYNELLRERIRIYEYRAGTTHAKALNVAWILERQQ